MAFPPPSAGANKKGTALPDLKKSFSLRFRVNVAAMIPGESVRADKWLWAVRIFKTRGLAAEACRAGHVEINGQPAKASREVKVGDVLCAQTSALTRTVRALGLTAHRVGASRVAEFAEDLTPASEYAKAREKSFAVPGHRPKGSGRPTKKDRRQMDKFSF